MKTIGIVLLSIGFLSLFGGLVNPSGAQIEVVITGYILKFLFIILGIFLITKKSPSKEYSNQKEVSKKEVYIRDYSQILKDIFPDLKEISNSNEEYIFGIDGILTGSGIPGKFVYKLCIRNNQLFLACSFKDDNLSLEVSSEMEVGNISTLIIKRDEIINTLDAIRSKISFMHTKESSEYISLTLKKRNLLSISKFLEIKKQEIIELRDREKHLIEEQQAYIKPYVQKTKTFTSDNELKEFSKRDEIFRNEIANLEQEEQKLVKESLNLETELNTKLNEYKLLVKKNQ